MRFLVIFFAMLALAGCARKVYVHPTKTAADFNRDKYECQQSATQNAYQMGMAGNPFWIADQTNQCMEMKHGWTERAQQSQ